LERQFTRIFYAAAAVFVVAIFAARSRRGVAAAAFAVVALRFGFAFFVSLRLGALLGLVVFGVISFLLVAFSI